MPAPYGENAYQPCAYGMDDRAFVMLTTDNARGRVCVRSMVIGEWSREMSDYHNETTRVVPLGRSGKYGSMTVDTTRFNAIVQDYVYDYGLRQILNDAMADKTDDDGKPLSDEAIVAKAQKRLDTLYSGELRTHRASSEPIDPVEREAYRIAREKIEMQFKGLDVWPTKGKDKFQTAVDARRVAMGNDPMTANEYIEAWLERNPKVRAAAKRIVAQRDIDAGEFV